MSEAIMGVFIAIVLFALVLGYVIMFFVPANTTEVDIHECPIVKEKDSDH